MNEKLIDIYSGMQKYHQKHQLYQEFLIVALILYAFLQQLGEACLFHHGGHAGGGEESLRL